MDTKRLDSKLIYCSFEKMLWLDFLHNNPVKTKLSLKKTCVFVILKKYFIDDLNK